ncbi:hypothetical protein Gohar_019654 [Gossypium harknessii]|uniref:RNase H type-1 domain-containing protein n=1 Tax=Gossypium harknessii TaxID=34285 RepID=A0A7J9I620_9ROSI|nr:hypothetical protein [Gossypium harknessii]
MGYNRFLGECSVFDVELWGILDGLSLIQDKHFEGVLIQVDSLKMIETIREFSSTDSNSTLIRRIHQILAKVGHWVIEYIPNELNEIAAELNWLLIQIKTRQFLKKSQKRY